MSGTWARQKSIVGGRETPSRPRGIGRAPRRCVRAVDARRRSSRGPPVHEGPVRSVAAGEPTKDIKDYKDSRDNEIPDFGIILRVFEVLVVPDVLYVLASCFCRAGAPGACATEIPPSPCARARSIMRTCIGKRAFGQEG